MKSKILFLLLALLLFPSQFVFGQGDVAILSPKGGEGVKGRVIISGYIKATNALRYDLDFAYTGQESSGWQPIASAAKPAGDGTLGIWDTSAISAGNYTLRLRVYLNDEQTSDHLVENIRVRNYSTMETTTPAAGIVESNQPPTLTPINLLPVGASEKPLPVNPGALTAQRFQLNLVFAIAIGILLAIILAYFFTKGKTSR